MESDKYDYILISVLHENLADKIRDDLINEYGMINDKIMWIHPEKIERN